MTTRKLFKCPGCGKTDLFVIGGVAHDRTYYYIEIDKADFSYDTVEIMHDEVGETDWNESAIKCVGCGTVIDLAVLRDGIDYGNRTREQMIEVLKDPNAGECPYCAAVDSTSFGTIEIEGPLATQSIHCGECEKSWTEIYRLEGFSMEDKKGERFYIDIEE